MTNILKHKLFLPVLFAAVLTGCMPEGRDINYNIVPGDELYAPQNEASVDLARGSDIEFSWAPAMAEDNGYISYEILFDKEDGDFSEPISSVPSQLNGSKTSLAMASKDLNSVARAAGIGGASTGKLKWTVRASKGIGGVVYPESHILEVSTMNTVTPIPETLVLKGDALEDSKGISLIPSQGIDNTPATEGVFECFTMISGGKEFSVEDELGRFYVLNENGTVTESAEKKTNTFQSEAIYWLKIDLGVMTWSSNTISKVVLYAAAWADGKMSTAREPMKYSGKGVWVLENYANTISDNSAKDSRHRFDVTLGDGSMLYLGTLSKLGTEYTVDYMKVNLYSKSGVGNLDWDKTYNFLEGDCGRAMDCFLYMNGDNPAGTWWHEYKFK